MSVIIKELARDLEEIERDAYSQIVKETQAHVKKHHRYNSKVDYSLAHTKTVYELTAEGMVKLGYRKIPEDSVVLSKTDFDVLLPTNRVMLSTEEYNALLLGQNRLREIVDRIPCGYELKEITRKQTAEKILKDVLELFPKDKRFTTISRGAIYNLAKQFGVGVEK